MDFRTNPLLSQHTPDLQDLLSSAWNVSAAEKEIISHANIWTTSYHRPQSNLRDTAVKSMSDIKVFSDAAST